MVCAETGSVTIANAVAPISNLNITNSLCIMKAEGAGSKPTLFRRNNGFAATSFQRGLHHAADNFAIRQHIEIVVIPFAGWARG